MRTETRTGAAIALVLICTLAVAAQQPALSPAATDVFLVPISVTDRNGRFVRGLTSDDFEIWEGGTRRTVKQFSAGRVPISLGILLDISGNTIQGPDALTGEEARWDNTRRALETLLARLDAADEILFAVFNDQLAASSWTQDHGRMLDAFDALRPSGGTALLQAITQITPAFRIAGHRRKVLLLISDGNDTGMSVAGALPPPPSEIGDHTAHFGDSQRTRHGVMIGASQNAIRRSDAMLYAIGMSIRKGQPVHIKLLDGLTKPSGGYSEPVSNPTDVAAAVERIFDDLQSQYLLTFEPAHADGKYHQIRVRTKDTSLKVRTRAGYVAPSGP